MDFGASYRLIVTEFDLTNVDYIVDRIQRDRKVILNKSLFFKKFRSNSTEFHSVRIEIINIISTTRKAISDDFCN